VLFHLAKTLFFGALLVALVAFVWTTYKDMEARRREDPHYSILHLILLPKGEEKLPTRYFAEKLGLSTDLPINMYRFDIKAAQSTLEAEAILRSVQLRLFTPGILAIHYEARSPCIYLGDYPNTAVDQDGVRMPYAPFFTPRRLPKLYCGKTDDAPIWGGKVDPHYWEIVKQLLPLAGPTPKWPGMTLQLIDLSRMHAPTAGSREMIIQVDEELLTESKELGSLLGRLYLQPIYLRLGVVQDEDGGAGRDGGAGGDGWARYEAFRHQRPLWTAQIQWQKGEKMPGDKVWKLPPMLLDLRLPQLGYWQGERDI
jgi:hypothetical protein